LAGVRVSELCNVAVPDVDLEACKIRINGGSPLPPHAHGGPSDTAEHEVHDSARPAEQAAVKASPHTLRHQAGLADAELQLITGHARRETLAVDQHVALDGDLEQKYQEAMKKVDL
jgi:integrase